MKRLSLLLSDLLPMLASAQNSTSDNNVIRYTTTDNKVLNKEGICDANLISNTYADGQGVMVFDKPITEIGWATFGSCTSLKSIKIPNSVTEIGPYAFAGCTSLTSIKIPDSITKIGESAFYKCTSLESFYGKFASEDNRCLIKDGALLAFAPNGLTEYTIPDSVTCIGKGAFEGYTSLTSVTIPNSVTTIGNLAFYDCTSLTSITIPNSVTYIGEYAFSGCTSLESITIPNSVTKIDGGAFSGCTSLKSITIPNGVTYIGYDAFDGCTSLKSVTIPNSITEIGFGAFRECTALESFYGKFASEDNRCLIKDGVLLAFAPNGLTEYTIPNSVTTIGWDAFLGCTSLKSIKIPNSVTEIRNSAFDGCTSLESITIPDSVTTIGWDAFRKCTSLTSVKIPNSVTEIGWAAFAGCTSLESFYGKFASEDNCCLIKDGVFLAFAPNGLTEYTIPNSVTMIGGYAFYDCTSLTSVKIPNSVTWIGWSAFDGCTSLTSVTIPNSVTKIDGGAFSGCTSLSSFYGKFASEDNRCLIKDRVLLAFAPSGLTEYTIPNSVTTIGNRVFKGCTSLTSVYCKPTTPPTVYYRSIFHDKEGKPLGCKIYVPRASVEAYKTAKGWKEHADNIVGYDF